MSSIPATPETWVAGQLRSEVERARAALDACAQQLDADVKMPLNVACSSVMKGLLARHGRRISVSGEAHVHRHSLGLRSQQEVLPQLATLATALRRARLALRYDAKEPAAAAARAAAAELRVAELELSAPSEAVRFPLRFMELGPGVPSGFCGEAFVCERTNLVFNLHAYQDSGSTYLATETVSVKDTDAGLVAVWASVDEILGMLDRIGHLSSSL